MLQIVWETSHLQLGASIHSTRCSQEAHRSTTQADLAFEQELWSGQLFHHSVAQKTNSKFIEPHPSSTPPFQEPCLCSRPVCLPASHITLLKVTGHTRPSAHVLFFQLPHLSKPHNMGVHSSALDGYRDGRNRHEALRCSSIGHGPGMRPGHSPGLGAV